MRYKNYIFDLYGTLVDIHTEEDNQELWEKMRQESLGYCLQNLPLMLSVQ